jgi:hypothetical protein
VGIDDAVVQFDLAQGRRTEPLEDEQLAVAIRRQAEISQALLAQQLGSLSNSGVLPGRRGDRNFRRNRALFGGRGAVGFQPVIVTLPEGTQMQANAVISADRRYVRITAAPSFTGIGNVTTFTFAGSSRPSGGAGGGGGGGAGGGGGGGF